jgi:general secretion pathway protein D
VVAGGANRWVFAPSGLRQRVRESRSGIGASLERRIVLKTSQLFAGWVVLSVALATTTAGARPLDGVSRCWMSAVAISQTAAPRATEADRHEVEKLLNQARQAIAEAHYETADSLISRAEAMKVEFGLFHVGDTPKKARRDLEAAKHQGKRPAPQKPGQKARQESAAEQAQPPRANAQIAAPAAPGGSFVDSDNLPTLDRRDTAMGRAGLARPTEINPTEEMAVPGETILPNDNPSLALPASSSLELRRKSDALLVDSRRTLATGDVRQATVLVEQAKTLKVGYGFHDDSPAKVESLIRKYKEMSEQDGGRPTTDAARRRRTEVLMEESEQLMRWGECDEAERLATDAAALRVPYGPFDASPKTLLKRIADEREKRKGMNKTAVAAAAAAGAAEAAAELPTLAAAAATTAAVDLRGQALQLTKQARAALAAGQLDLADQLARQAESLRVPNNAYGPQDDRPGLVALEVSKARARSQVAQRAGGPIEVGNRYPVTQTVFDEQHDPTRNLAASSAESIDSSAAASDEATDRLPNPADSGPPAGSEALNLFQMGEQALRDRKPEVALQLFRQAYALRNQLNPQTAQKLQDHLQLLSASPSGRQAPPKVIADNATSREQLLGKQLSAEVARQQDAARKITEKNPKQAAEIIEKLRVTIDAADVNSDLKTVLLKRVDASQKEFDKFVNENRGQIELDEQNREVMDKVESRRRKRIETDTQLAMLVDEYNKLMEERRFPEAEVIAKRVQALDPTNPLAKQLLWNAKFIIRTNMSKDIEARKEQGVVDAFMDVDRASIPWDTNDVYHMPPAKEWKDLTENRKKYTGDSRTRRSERELDIERKLKTPVSANFQDMPLNEVLHQLARLAAINLHLDPKGLTEEGVAPDTPVTLNLNQEVSLKSALHLILEPLRLNYVIKDEVLKVTSEQLRDNEVYTVLYGVGDLVIPIPNFVPNNQMGLAGALHDAQASVGPGGSFLNSGMGGPSAVLASRDGGAASGMINPAVLGQMMGGNMGGMMGPRAGQPQNVPFGPGGMGGGQQADFDSLMELITSTIQPTSWDEVGGPGSIAEFATNLSLVISQTQEVHEQIVDLLEQLRRLQDLQVTIEVRFITLNDDFFEQIGVDMQLDLPTHVTATELASANAGNSSAVVGLNPPAAGAPFPNFTSTLDIPFNQSSFGLATPQFAQPVQVASFGFAILSDIEAYFLVNASQGDRRSNVLQAPKVTLFNGQQAFVSDTTQTPFVISVIPVVGDFAAANQPVIVVLNEGTFLTVQAVISNDRRFVRLTVVPFFSQIGNVQEFTFSGNSSTTKQTSSSNSSAGGDTTAANGETDTSTNNGITVQLPSFSFVTVTTTVSVPDGGTVLLGGIKRLSEGRNEFGVPILSKIPYINRLFKNVGIGRETQSLMMMVTPRIIIQEEEEDRLGIASP